MPKLHVLFNKLFHRFNNQHSPLKNMSQAFKDEITYSTGNDIIEYILRTEFLTESTETTESETQEIFLVIPENESLEDYNKEMDAVTDSYLSEDSD